MLDVVVHNSILTDCPVTEQSVSQRRDVDAQPQQHSFIWRVSLNSVLSCSNVLLTPRFHSDLARSQHRKWTNLHQCQIHTESFICFEIDLTLGWTIVWCCFVVYSYDVAKNWCSNQWQHFLLKGMGTPHYDEGLQGHPHWTASHA